MADKVAKSGKIIGQDYIARMRSYLTYAGAMPLSSDGSVNITLLANLAGIPKQSIYKNPTIKKLVEDERLRQGVMSRTELRGVELGAGGARGAETIEKVAEERESRKVRAVERQNHELEQKNVALVAENAELRRQVRELRLEAERMDFMIETGRRIPALPRTQK